MTRALIAAGCGLLVGALLACVFDNLYTDERLTRAPRLPSVWEVLLAPAVAGVFAGAAVETHDALRFVLLAVSGAVLVLLAALDFKRHLLPDRVMLPALALALAVSWLWPGRPPTAGLTGGAAGFAILFAIFFVVPGFGFGDVKLAALIGLLVGWPAVLRALVAGILLGGVASAFLLVTRRVTFKSAIAYGPYLVGGALLELLSRH